MCRLALKTANDPFSPYEVLEAMEAMKEGYDGSGLGLLLRGMEFEDFKYNPRFPILSGIAESKKAWKRLDRFMEDRGYELKYDHKFHMDRSHMDGKDRYRYFLRAYRMPEEFQGKPMGDKDREEELMETRLALRQDGEKHGGDLSVFSFWPDVAMIKEVGWPLQVGNLLSLHDGQIKSRVCMAQGRQNTNYGINLYACHPFFVQGISTMGRATQGVRVMDLAEEEQLVAIARLAEGDEVKAGDVVSVKEKSIDILPIQFAIDTVGRTTPEWLNVDANKRTITVDTMPSREQIDTDIKEQLIVELYSR